MNTSLETEQTIHPMSKKKTKKIKRKKWIQFLGFILVWALLISGGLYGSKMYVEHLKEQILADLSTQMEEKLSDVQVDVAEQIDEVEINILSDIETLQEQITSFNQLLNFAKDSTNDQTDNSNQLYSQLVELQEQLSQLQKELDLIK
ncbi:hypothetical protein [Chengkuizengella axinellae]|uniref:Uncharacterized protein n=1 Tax=Chengkuizengella axinellae TaxID=3064388 RepID=A0ABT9J0L5_9BACL|nr:hypothetical protein [Chengkuizengella sp. 2205SS18-9]MDP5275164.1 hypothetical protein [Chengkuizengella sp. 2205SS18-9]